MAFMLYLLAIKTSIASNFGSVMQRYHDVKCLEIMLRAHKYAITVSKSVRENGKSGIKNGTLFDRPTSRFL